ncbi:MAG: (Fe-S)-binding protein, partial [Candidatus Binataceae bacterium]
MLGALFPYPFRMRTVLAPLRLIERAGLRSSLQRIVPRALREWLELLPPLVTPRTPLPSPTTPTASPDAPSVVVHHGCVTQVLAPSENSNSEALLARAGYKIAHLERTTCCGALDLHAGNYERALSFARDNISALKGCGADSIVSAASGCSAVMAEYGDLLRNDADLAADARDVAARVKDLSSLLLARNAVVPGQLTVKVTYHDACHLAHGLGVRDAPRALLRSIPGLELIELAESDLCCGSAGSYNLTEPAMARTLARRKVDNILASGADFVVLANPGCEFQIGAELKRRGATTRVMHLADFLALAAGSEQS